MTTAIDLNDLRARVLAGDDTVTTEELAAAIAALRANRTTAQTASAASPRQAKKAAAGAAKKDINDLLGDIGL